MSCVFEVQQVDSTTSPREAWIGASPVMASVLLKHGLQPQGSIACAPCETIVSSGREAGRAEFKMMYSINSRVGEVGS